MMRAPQNPVPGCTDAYVSTLNDFYLDPVRNHPFHDFKDFLHFEHTADPINCRLASKILNLKASSGEEKQNAILAFQNNWKLFVAKLRTHLINFTLKKEIAEQHPDKAVLFLEETKDSFANLIEHFRRLKDDVNSIILASSNRHNSGIQGLYRLVQSRIWTIDTSFTEKVCKAIAVDFNNLHRTLQNCVQFEAQIFDGITLNHLKFRASS